MRVVTRSLLALALALGAAACTEDGDPTKSNNEVWKAEG